MLATLAATVAIAAPASAADDAPPSTRTVVPVKARQTYTNTAIALNKGDTVAVRAKGEMHFGGGAAEVTKPAGVPWASGCGKLVNVNGRPFRWPAPGLNCWSLIARIGTGKPFEIGAANTFVADRDGTLYLGLNDNFVGDNRGKWTATVTVTPVVPTKSHTMTYVLIALALIAVFVLLFLLWRQYRKRPKPERKQRGQPTEAAVVPAHLVGLATAEAEGAPVAPPPEEPVLVAAPAVATPFAGPQADSIDVNIFEVEFSNGLTMRVGYNHFPGGTNLRWRVTQDRLPVAVGEFVTEGGGSTNHFETVPLGAKLEGRDTKPDGADVQFDWSINGVPFRYSVRRDANC